ncbi:hypothetical protein POTOM_039958 [Populus tomentosa]|uniref:non-specific serine/threonine protein kinase n=1 Tax=Populus tomentosa TaxID=118781 RepID=A0A8X7YXT6_POPTO|nr:hypothetical protein POTOM_039958 [Populus tomentosa]
MQCILYELTASMTSLKRYLTAGDAGGVEAKSKEKKQTLIIILVPSVAVVFLSLALFLLLRRKKRLRKRKMKDILETSQNNKGKEEDLELPLFDINKTRNKVLDWPKRFHIINGIARGLLYLHQDSRLRIIHRDLKASNILLDDEMNPKISDFGLARSVGGSETEANTNKVVGTYGYISPEYAIDGLYSVKSDVFSFGVMVLEIVSGKRNKGFCHPDSKQDLLGYAWRLFIEGGSPELIAESIVESCNLYEALRSIQIGLLCVQRSPRDRPSMSTVVMMLGSESELPQPKEPGFFTTKDSVKASSSSIQSKISANEITMTQLEAR